MIKFKTTIEVIDAGFDNDSGCGCSVGIPKSILTNLISSKEGNVAPLSSHNHVDVKTYNLTTDQGASFNKNLLDNIDDNAANEIVGIAIYAHKKKLAASDSHDPRKFALSLGAVALGNLSQFTLLNVDASTLTDITLSNVIVPADEQAILKVITILNKAA